MIEKNESLRLNRFLALAGLGSRRSCELYIQEGRVEVNGEVTRVMATTINPDRDVVKVDNKLVEIGKNHTYLMFHKPFGLIVTAKDENGRLTIYDAIKKLDIDVKRLKYAGRLDRDSEGLLILSDDGELILRLTHPRFHLRKVYRVQSSRELSFDDITKLTTTGVESEGDMLRAVSIQKLMHAPANSFLYSVGLAEGKKRHIRRMFDAMGCIVQRLVRVAVGPITLGNLSPGCHRMLTPLEVDTIKRACGMD